MGVMIKRLAALFASGAVLAALLVAMTPLSAHAVENEAYVEGEVIVEFDGYASNGEKRAALVSAGATSVEYVDCYTDETEPPSVFSELVIARFDGVPMDQAVAALERASCVKRAMPNSFYGYEVGGRFVDFVEGWFTGYRELSVSFASDATSEDKRALYDDLSAVSVSESQGDCTIVLPDHLSVAYAMKRADAPSSVVFAGPVYPLYSGSHFPPSDMMESSKYDTAAEQALKAYPAGAEDVVLVSGSVWPEGLGASGLAGALDAPVLLVEHGHVPQRTLDAMKALGSARAIIVGGDAVVSPAVEDTIRSAVGSDPVRLAGIHATDTAGAVFDWGVENGLWDSGLLLAATNRSFYDSLSLSALAASQGAPILLCNGSGTLSSADWARVSASGASLMVFAGGDAVVSEEAVGTAQDILGPAGAVRLAGDTLYQTSFAVADWCVSNGYLSWDGMAFASGAELSYTDALCGSALQGVRGSVTLIVYDSAYGTSELSALSQHAASGVSGFDFFGGTAVMSQDFRYRLMSALL